MLPLSIFPSSSSCTVLPSFSHNDGSPVGQGIDYRQYCLGNKGESLPFLGFGTLVVFLLFVCAILAGLTLAICSLDMTKLHVLSMSGDQKMRNQALVISRIKRHGSWFLCSMIICSVTCAESIPIIIEMLFGTGWLPIVVSTITIAIFAELLPQYIIPRRAVAWGYYCWPFIWSCMWLTCIISWPLSYLLDMIPGPPTGQGIYTLEQLEVLIKFHERTEKHGGLLGPDAGTVMRSALLLDSQTIRGDFQSVLGKGKAPVADIERGEAVRGKILIPWSSVRRIHINEEVTKELILRIKSWAYSRILIVGDVEASNLNSMDCDRGWDGQKVYGFLHVKNLVGLVLPEDNSKSKKLFVKDLALYPVPIVRDDMPLYDLLNVFQLGMSRIAVVIPTPIKDQLVPLSASMGNLHVLPRYAAPLWSALTGLNTGNITEMDALEAHIDWTTDFLDAVQNEIGLPIDRKHSIIGVGCPEPIGIVTYEDILNVLLRKKSLDEKDFFDRDHFTALTIERNEGDTNSVSSNHSVVRTKETDPPCSTKLHAAFKKIGRSSDMNDGILRRRIISRPELERSEGFLDDIRRLNITGPDDGVDGRSGNSRQGFDGANERGGTVRIQQYSETSSYTENTLGGFHDTSPGVELIHSLELPSAETSVDSTILPMSLAFPPYKSFASADNDDPTGLWYNPSDSNCNVPSSLPRVRRVIPFSKESSEGYGNTRAVKRCLSATFIKKTRGNVQDDEQLDEPCCECCLAEDSFDSPDPMTGNIDGSQGLETRPRNGSFQDDRTLLPSQRKRRPIES